MDGVIYGIHQNANGGNVDGSRPAKSGMTTLWEEKVGRNRSGSICYADGRLYCYNDKDGSVILVEPSRKQGWQPAQGEAHATASKRNCRSRTKERSGRIPVVADQMLIIRDQDSDLFAYDIGR